MARGTTEQIELRVTVDVTQTMMGGHIHLSESFNLPRGMDLLQAAEVLGVVSKALRDLERDWAGS